MKKILNDSFWVREVTPKDVEKYPGSCNEDFVDSKLICVYTARALFESSRTITDRELKRIIKSVSYRNKFEDFSSKINDLYLFHEGISVSQNVVEAFFEEFRRVQFENVFLRKTGTLEDLVNSAQERNCKRSKFEGVEKFFLGLFPARKREEEVDRVMVTLATEDEVLEIAKPLSVPFILKALANVKSKIPAEPLEYLEYFMRAGGIEVNIGQKLYSSLCSAFSGMSFKNQNTGKLVVL